jgi:CBS-domain-containing membrane protein
VTGHPSALNRAAAALGALLAVAVVSRVAWELLRPLAPTLLVLLAVCAIYSRVIRR